MENFYTAFEEYNRIMNDRVAAGGKRISFDEWLEEGEEYTGEADFNDSVDGDFDSAMASAGFGTDEDYNHYEYEGDF